MRMRNFRTRVGAASFYVVIFTTMLFTIITMSFIRLMIYETTRTINNDLSNSAYDSALAGVEDAKVALLKYQSCINAKDTTSDACKNVVSEIQAGMKGEDCATVAKALGRIGDDETSAEVKIEENTDTGSAGAEASVAMEQAYTCVKIYTTVAEYKATLDNTTRVKVVPLRGGDGAEDNVKYLDLVWSWTGNYSAGELGKFGAQGSGQKAPPIVFDVYQTDENYTLGELSVKSDVGTDHFSLVFQPTDLSGEEVTEVKANDILGKYDSKTAENSPIGVKCGGNRCHVKIQLPETFQGSENRNASTFLARAEILYNTPSVDFEVRMLDSAEKTIPFVDVQAAVDSTGRANDLHRRVEARVELNDTNYPYPEFAVQLLNPSSVTEKNFYITQHCWTVSEGTASDCDNYGSI